MILWKLKEKMNCNPKFQADISMALLHRILISESQTISWQNMVIEYELCDLPESSLTFSNGTHSLIFSFVPQVSMRV